MALDEKDIEIIVQNYFNQQFVAINIKWKPFPSISSQAKGREIKRFVDSLNQLTTKFKSSLGFYQIDDKVDDVVVALDKLASDRFDEAGYGVFSGIADELCTEGIMWSHIVTLFVFTFVLANEYLQVKNDLKKFENIVNWLILYVSERLLEWINNHGGSIGITKYYYQSYFQNLFHPLGFWKTTFLATGIYYIFYTGISYYFKNKLFIK